MFEALPRILIRYEYLTREVSTQTAIPHPFPSTSNSEPMQSATMMMVPKPVLRTYYGYWHK